MHNILEAMSEVPIVKQTGGPRRFLTILGESRRLMEQIRSGPRGRNEQLALSTGLYCVTIRYRGRAYVARVATTPSLRETEASPWVEEVFVPLHPDSDFLILYHDEMGVLKIEFFRDEDEVTVDDTYPSYQVLPLGKPANDTLLQFIYNDLFLRMVVRCPTRVTSLALRPHPSSLMPGETGEGGVSQRANL